MATTLRVGILGAAHVAPSAMIEPARHMPGVEVVAVAARDVTRAREFAEAHGIASACRDYGSLVQRDDLDAVYVALPASAHAEWVAQALEAGKHVLCEKPLATCSQDARALVALAATKDRILCEAYHYRYHPLADRMLDIVASGVLGDIEHIDAKHLNSVPGSWPVYWSPSLGGGTTLHTGCYPAHCARMLMGEEPTVRSASAVWRDGVDAWHRAEMSFASGATAVVESSMEHGGPPQNSIRVVGIDGVLEVSNFIIPHFGLAVRSLRSQLELQSRSADTVTERFGLPSTYQCQLESFTDAVLTGAELHTGGSDSIATADLLDSMLAAAS